MKPNQKRMQQIVERFQKYVATYTDQSNYLDYSDDTFIQDMIYGIGIAINPDNFKYTSGYDRFKAELSEKKWMA